MKTEPRKPVIMILGSDHFNNPGVNAYNIKYDDVRAPKRQTELEELVQRLKGFNPTHVAVNIDESADAKTQENYCGYLNGTYQLSRSEYEQIGFRMAKEVEHSRLYCVDYWPEQNPFFPDDFDWNLMNYFEFAKTHSQEHLLPMIANAEEFWMDEAGRNWIDFDPYESLVDMHKRINTPEYLQTLHEFHLRIAQIGKGSKYPGANWVVHFWYDRNLKIYSNLTRITETPYDRILLIIGSGHVWIVQQFLEDSKKYAIESPLTYLDAEGE